MTKPYIDKLITFIQEDLASDSQEITADTKLFEERIISSMNILDLISFIEQERGAKIPDDEVVMKNFQTPQKMAHTFLSDHENE